MGAIVYNGNTPPVTVSGAGQTSMKVMPFGAAFDISADTRIVGKEVNSSFELAQLSDLDVDSQGRSTVAEAWSYHPHQTYVYSFIGLANKETIATYDGTTGEFVGSYGVSSGLGSNGPGVVPNGALSSNRDALGNNYLLSFGLIGFDMQLMDIDTEDGVPTYLDHLDYGAGSVDGRGAFAPLPPDENGDARWIFSQCGAVVDTDRFPQTYNLITYTGGSLVRTEIAQWVTNDATVFTGDVNVNQVGMILEDHENDQWIFVHRDDSSGNCIVGAVSKSDTSILVWETLLPDNLNGYYREYSGSLIQDSLLAVPCNNTSYLINTQTGTVVDSGPSPTIADHGAYWDGLRRALFISSSDEDTLLHRLEFTNAPAREAPEESTNAITIDPILRSSDVTAVVNENAGNIQALLSGLVDATLTNYPSLTIDLNGYSFTNLAPDSGNDNEIARQPSE